jgi:hypothetical protein
VVLLFTGTENIAQTNKGAGFESYNAVGFLAGKAPVAFSAQTVNGLRYRGWFVGAGFGIDEYVISSLPLFLAVKKEFSVKNAHLFLYGDAGTHFITKNKNRMLAFSKEQSKAMLYLDAGLGVKLKTGKKNNVFFTVGNSLKTMEETENSIDTGIPFSNKTIYKFSRISFRAGFQF